jgi:hypothetical protein
MFDEQLRAKELADVVDGKVVVKDYTWDHEYQTITELKVFKHMISECMKHNFFDKPSVCIFEGLPAEDENSIRHLTDFWRLNKLTF